MMGVRGREYRMSMHSVPSPADSMSIHSVPASRGFTTNFFRKVIGKQLH